MQNTLAILQEKNLLQSALKVHQFSGDRQHRSSWAFVVHCIDQSSWACHSWWKECISRSEEALGRGVWFCFTAVLCPRQKQAKTPRSPSSSGRLMGPGRELFSSVAFALWVASTVCAHGGAYFIPGAQMQASTAAEDIWSHAGLLPCGCCYAFPLHSCPFSYRVSWFIIFSIITQ